MKDTRVALNYVTVKWDGNVFRVDGKYDCATGKLKIYRFHGDCRQQMTLGTALRASLSVRQMDGKLKTVYGKKDVFELEKELGVEAGSFAGR
jgi:hypothetical protein